MSDEMEKYFTRDRAEAGIKLPLTDVTGRKTGDWLLIRGTDSLDFTLANSHAMRRAVEIQQIKDETERDLETIKMARELVATLVMGWSFEKECTREAVIDFLERAPQVQKQVDVSANSRALFWQVESGASAEAPKQNSSST